MALLVLVGVPVIAPVLPLRLKPAGRDGETLYVRVPVPFAPVTGVNEVAERLWVREMEATACVAVTAEFTVRLNVLNAVALFWSVTVTV